MKTYKFLLALAVASLVFVGGAKLISAEEGIRTELQKIVKAVQERYSAGNTKPEDFSDVIKQFDELLEKHKGEKTDDVAMIAMMKASLYIELFEDYEKGISLLEQLKKDFPDTAPAKDVDQIVASIKRAEQQKKTQANLKVGAPFPDFQEKDVNGKPISVSAYKGKVVLIDFWATWCGPCVRELPNVLEAYNKYHDKGFEIIGISLDQEKDQLLNFTKQKQMPWQQYFDGKGWENKLAGIYGVNSIPATYLLDKNGVIIDKDLRGAELVAAIEKALK